MVARQPLDERTLDACVHFAMRTDVFWDIEFATLFGFTREDLATWRDKGTPPPEFDDVGMKISLLNMILCYPHGQDLLENIGCTRRELEAILDDLDPANAGAEDSHFRRLR